MNIFIEVIGCTANRSDACIVHYLIGQHPSYVLVHDSDDADIIILFTCTVIAATEQRMFSKIKQYVSQQKTIIITGCMASIQSESIKHIQKDILCIPPSQIHHLLSYLKKSENMNDAQEKYLSKKQYNPPIAPIAISEGCDFSCTYCITTLARGKLTSFPRPVIKQDVKQAVRQGCKEIQLTAQDTASYGRDVGSHLAALLIDLTSLPGWYRFRVGMMNPATLFPQIDQMITAFSDVHIYKFLHIPVQSGDDHLLSLMGRRYTIQNVFTIVNRFRAQFPHITIATDVIVGFPSENEMQHAQTKKFLEKMQPDIVNITKFSARPYTKAKTMIKRIPTEIVKQRSKELTTVTSAISLMKNSKYIGKKYPVLITEKGKQQSMMGRTDQYKPVVLFESVHIGDIVDVEITDAKETYLVGTLI